MKNKKVLIITIIIILSLVISIFDDNSFLVNTEQLIPLLFTLLGLCLTAYTFIYSPIINLLQKNENERVKNSLKILLEAFEKDMIFIFYAVIVIILISFIKNFNIPFIKNPLDLDFGIFSILSLKECILDFGISFFSSLSFYSLYDLIKGTFKILRSSFEI